MSFEIIGHRGAAGHAPENTAASFHTALAMNVDAIELDIHVSKDKRIVVMHDAKVDRTTNGTGNINDMTVRELQALDAGSWFDPMFSGETVPLLEDVLHIVGNETPLVIEIKERTHTALLIDMVATLLAQHSLRVVISSFMTEALRLAQQQIPHIPRAWLMRPHQMTLDKTLHEAERLELFQLCPRAPELDEAWVQRVHNAGYKVRAWGIPTTETAVMTRTIRHLLRLGVDGATADYPDVMRTTLLTYDFVQHRSEKTEHP